VACRTCVEAGADAVLALSFPLVPPGKDAAQSRIGELLVPVEAGLPVAVVQGVGDPFGTGEDVREALGERGGDVLVADVAGNHSLTAPVRDVVPAVLGWLTSAVA
jgi:predicted alpha/beta-hydrolase family hydrolase